MAARIHTGCVACSYSARTDESTDYFTDNPQYDKYVYSIKTDRTTPRSFRGYWTSLNGHAADQSPFVPPKQNGLGLHNQTNDRRQSASKKSKKRGDSGRALGVAGCLLVLFGLLLLMVNIAGLILNGWGFTYSAILLGIWVSVSGIFCVAASDSSDAVLVLASMVFAITTCGDVWWPIAEYMDCVATILDLYEEDKTTMALYIAMLVLAFLAFLAAIAAAVTSAKLIVPRLTVVLRQSKA